MNIQLQLAKPSDLDILVPLVRDYHQFENLDCDEANIRQAIIPLLENNELGYIWLIKNGHTVIGYIVLCLGYSIEFSGSDAFIDEFFIIQSQRAQGFGKQVLQLIKQEAKNSTSTPCTWKLHATIMPRKASMHRLASNHGTNIF